MEVNLMVLLLSTACPHCPDFLLLILAFFPSLQWINLHDGSDLGRTVDNSLLGLLQSGTASKTTNQEDKI